MVAGLVVPWASFIWVFGLLYVLLDALHLFDLFRTRMPDAILVDRYGVAGRIGWRLKAVWKAKNQPFAALLLLAGTLLQTAAWIASVAAICQLLLALAAVPLGIDLRFGLLKFVPPFTRIPWQYQYFFLGIIVLYVQGNFVSVVRREVRVVLRPARMSLTRADIRHRTQWWQLIRKGRRNLLAAFLYDRAIARAFAEREGTSPETLTSSLPRGQATWETQVRIAADFRYASAFRYVVGASLAASVVSTWRAAGTSYGVWHSHKGVIAAYVIGTLIDAAVASLAWFAVQYKQLPIRTLVAALRASHLDERHAADAMRTASTFRTILRQYVCLALALARRYETTGLEGITEPAAVLLRSAALRVNEFLGSKEAVDGVLPVDVRSTLLASAFMIADPSRLENFRDLVDLGYASESTVEHAEQPGDNYSRNLTAKIARRIINSLEVAHKAVVTVVGIITILTIVILIFVGHVGLSFLPNLAK